jgi:hypothetical protein
LNESREKELFNFLDKNPLLKEEFECFDNGENVKLIPDSKVFAKKSMLKHNTFVDVQEISEIDYLMISDLEKDIKPEQKTQLDNLLASNPKCFNEYNLFGKTKLEYDSKIEFKYKNRIKRTLLPMGTIRTTLSIAAAATAFLLIINQLNFNDSLNEGNNGRNISLRNTNSKMALFSQSQNDNNSLNTSNKYTFKQATHKINNTINNSVSEQDSLNATNHSNYQEIKVPVKHERILISGTENINSLKTKNIEKKLLQPEDKSFISNVNLWAIAETGVKTWNAVTNSDASLNNKYNEKGGIEKLSFSYKGIKFSKSFNKNK